VSRETGTEERGRGGIEDLWKQGSLREEGITFILVTDSTSKLSQLNKYKKIQKQIFGRKCKDPIKGKKIL